MSAFSNCVRSAGLRPAANSPVGEFPNYAGVIQLVDINAAYSAALRKRNWMVKTRPRQPGFGAAVLWRKTNSAGRRRDAAFSPRIRFIIVSTAAMPNRNLGWLTVVSGTR